MKGILIGVIAVLALATAPARAGDFEPNSSVELVAMPKAAQKYVRKVVAAIEAGKVKAFLALLPRKLEVRGEYDAYTFTFTKAQLKKAIKAYGGLADALWLSEGDWTIAREDGGYALYRGPDGKASATFRIEQVKKTWRLTRAALIDRVDYASRMEAARYDQLEAQPGERVGPGGIFGYTPDGKPATYGKLVEPTSPDNVTSMKLADLQASGLDAATVRRYVKHKLSQLHYCYDKELLAVPGLKGEVKFQGTIDISGTVAGVAAFGISANVATCVGSVLRATEFPKNQDGEQTAFSGKLTFYAYFD
jgi:hypothetical protein